MHERCTLVSTISLLVGVFSVTETIAIGQIERLPEWNGRERIQLELPARIVISPDGQPEFDSARWGPVYAEMWRDSAWLPQSVPIYTRRPGGDLLIGGFPQNPSAHEIRSIQWREPIALVEQEDGAFELITAPRTFLPSDADAFPAEYLAPEPAVDRVPLVFRTQEAEARSDPVLPLASIELSARGERRDLHANVPLWAELDVPADTSRVVTGFAATREQSRPETIRCFVKDHNGDWFWGGYEENQTGAPASRGAFRGHWGISVKQTDEGEFILKHGQGSSGNPLHGPIVKLPAGMRIFRVYTIDLRIHYSGFHNKQQSRSEARGIIGPIVFLPKFVPDDWVQWPEERESVIHGMHRWSPILNTNVPIIF